MNATNRPEGRPATTAARHSSTPETLAERGWTAYATTPGIEFGAAYRGHHLSLMPWQGGWQWSATHPRMCSANRGHCGWTADVAEAEQRMRVAVDGFGCAARAAA